jgi:Family of unknown function (DUF5677)
MICNKDLPGVEMNDMATFTPITEEACCIAEKVFDALLALQTEHGGLTAALVARSAQSLNSVSHLANKGLNGDAMSVCRTIVEIAIDSSYIASNPNQLIPRFVDYGQLKRWELNKAAKGLQGQEVSSQYEEYFSYFEGEYGKSKLNWAGKSLRARVTEGVYGILSKENYDHLYGLAYAEMCGASHSGQNTLRYVAVHSEDGAVSIRFGPQTPSDHPVALACMAMAMLLSTAVHNLSLSDALRKDVEDFIDRLRAAHDT